MSSADNIETGTEHCSPHHYNLIASAVAGRAVTVHWHSSRKYQAYSDGHSIYLPCGNNAGENETFTLIAQALLLRAGSLQRRWVQRLVGQRQPAERYLYAEICRAARTYSHLLPRRFTSDPSLCVFSHRRVSTHSRVYRHPATGAAAD